MTAKDIQHTCIKVTDSIHWAVLLQSRNKQISRWKERHGTIKRKRISTFNDWHVLTVLEKWKEKLVTGDILNSNQPVIFIQ